MSNIKKPILRYTLIIVAIVGLLVLGYKVFFPKQYTEVEFGMSQGDLIRIKGEPDEVVDAPNGDGGSVFYHDKTYFDYPCVERYNFGDRGFLIGDGIELDGYGYKFKVNDIETAEKMFWDIRDKMQQIYGRQMEEQNSYLGHSVYMDTTDNTGFDFKEAYENGQGAYTSWLTDGNRKSVSIDKEYGFSVFFADGEQL